MDKVPKSFSYDLTLRIAGAVSSKVTNKVEQEVATSLNVQISTSQGDS